MAKNYTLDELKQIIVAAVKEAGRMGDYSKVVDGIVEMLEPATATYFFTELRRRWNQRQQEQQKEKKKKKKAKGFCILGVEPEVINPQPKIYRTKPEIAEMRKKLLDRTPYVSEGLMDEDELEQYLKEKFRPSTVSKLFFALQKMRDVEIEIDEILEDDEIDVTEMLNTKGES